MFIESNAQYNVTNLYIQRLEMFVINIFIRSVLNVLNLKFQLASLKFHYFQ